MSELEQRVNEIAQGLTRVETNQEHYEKAQEVIFEDLKTMAAQQVIMNNSAIESNTALSTAFKTTTIIWAVLIAVLGLSASNVNLVRE